MSDRQTEIDSLLDDLRKLEAASTANRNERDALRARWSEVSARLYQLDPGAFG